MAAMVLRHGMMTILLLLLGIGGGSQADGLEMVTDVNVTASMYDTRTSLEEDEYKGCYDTGCLPSYVLDGLLNDRPQSRWSCSEEIDLTIGECYMTFDLHDSFTLGELTIYFYKSNDTSREINRFNISTSADNVMYEFSFSGNNTLGTPLGTGENFSFPNEPSGRYVRLNAVMDSDEWLSINEVEIYYVDIGSPSPATIGTPFPTLSDDVASLAPSTRGVSGPSPTPTASPTELVKPSASSSLMSSMAPTPAPTSPPIEGDLECANVTVSNTKDLDGLYVWGSGTTFLSTGTKNATIESSQISIDCVDTTFTECFMTKWIIKDEQNPLLAYMAFDDAEEPALITQVWLRENCSNADCNSSPANVAIVCGDSSTFGASVPTPTPVSVTAAECEIVEVEGTSGGNLDGIYYDDGSPSQGGVAQFMGYEDDLTSNGNTLAAEWVNGGCPSPSGNTTIINDDCAWRKWSITPDSGNYEAFEHFTYDEADHPVDIASGILWYTSDTIEKPYEGDIHITCAPADTPPLLTPSPSSSPSPTKISNPTAAPSVSPSILTPVTSKDDGRGGMDYTPMIIAGVAGAAVLLTLAGCMAHRRLSKPIPLNFPSRPPPYNHLFDSAKH